MKIIILIILFLFSLIPFTWENRSKNKSSLINKFANWTLQNKALLFALQIILGLFVIWFNFTDDKESRIISSSTNQNSFNILKGVGNIDENQHYFSNKIDTVKLNIDSLESILNSVNNKIFISIRSLRHIDSNLRRQIQYNEDKLKAFPARLFVSSPSTVIKNGNLHYKYFIRSSGETLADSIYFSSYFITIDSSDKLIALKGYISNKNDVNLLALDSKEFYLVESKIDSQSNLKGILKGVLIIRIDYYEPLSKKHLNCGKPTFLYSSNVWETNKIFTTDLDNKSANTVLKFLKRDKNHFKEFVQDKDY